MFGTTNSLEGNNPPTASHTNSGKKPEGFNQQRADDYADATKLAPKARDAELLKVRIALDKLGRNNYDNILEIGVGQGFGTSALLDYLSPNGKIVGIDASEHMTQKISANSRVNIHIGALDELALKNESIDFAFSLAAFHHIPNKFLVLNEINRVLEPGAHFLIVDVNHATEAQETFDYIVREHCISGHDADFLDEEWVKLLCRRSKFEHVSSSIEEANWRFKSREEMIRYVRGLFCLELDDIGVNELVEKYLNPKHDLSENSWIMQWSLGFHLIRKPA